MYLFFWVRVVFGWHLTASSAFFWNDKFLDDDFFCRGTLFNPSQYVWCNNDIKTENIFCKNDCLNQGIAASFFNTGRMEASDDISRLITTIFFQFEDPSYPSFSPFYLPHKKKHCGFRIWWKLHFRHVKHWDTLCCSFKFYAVYKPIRSLGLWTNLNGHRRI